MGGNIECRESILIYVKSGVKSLPKNRAMLHYSDEGDFYFEFTK